MHEYGTAYVWYMQSTQGFDLEGRTGTSGLSSFTTFGLHPNQMKMERFYATSIKNVYYLILFCKLLRQAYQGALKDEEVARLVSENEQLCRALGCTGMTEDSKPMPYPPQLTNLWPTSLNWLHTSPDHGLTAR